MGKNWIYKYINFHIIFSTLVALKTWSVSCHYDDVHLFVWNDTNETMNYNKNYYFNFSNQTIFLCALDNVRKASWTETLKSIFI